MLMQDQSNAIKIYLREIGETPLLTREEEVVLAARIKDGDEEARQHMIRANLRLVVKIAHDYARYGLPLLDLISEGNIGLMKAVERFDPEKGGKLSTYAAWWSKQSIKRALANQAKTIRLPVHMVDKIAKMRRISGMLARVPGGTSLTSCSNRDSVGKFATPAAIVAATTSSRRLASTWSASMTPKNPPKPPDVSVFLGSMAAM